MRRKIAAVWWCVYALCGVVIFFYRAGDPTLLQDSDTVGILKGIQENPNWLSWFSRDWPLGNHFYRPVSTLTFVADSGGDAARYGATNAVLVSLSVLGLGWVSKLLAQLWRAPELLAAPILFTVWSLSWGYRLAVPILVVLAVLVVIRRDWRQLGFLGGIALLLLNELNGLSPLYTRMLAWIPGRTSSTMTVFFLPAVALVIAFWRRPHWALLVGACVMAFLALGSYEQAVMLIPVLGVLWLARPDIEMKSWTRWLLPLAAVTIFYFGLRYAVIPRGVSGYQSQQLISGTGGFYALADVALPGVTSIYNFLSVVSVGPLIFLAAEPYNLLLTILSPFIAIWFIAKSPRWRLVAGLWAASVLAYAPMAFFHQFEHYFFLPMAFRALFVCGLLGLILRDSEGRWNWRTSDDGGERLADPGAELEAVPATRA